MQYCGEFDNWGAVMAVSAELLCSFELLKPLDSSALKSHIKKGRNMRNSMLNSPVRLSLFFADRCLADDAPSLPLSLRRAFDCFTDFAFYPKGCEFFYHGV